MNHRFSWYRVLAFGLMAVFAANAGAQASSQAFPNRTLKFVVPFAAGGSGDLAARYLAKHMSEIAKQPIIIDNKPGANGIIGIQYALTLPADGYTVVISSSTTHASNPNLLKKLPYDAINDFVPLSGMLLGGMVLAVSPKIPANNVQELIALAKRHPGKLTFGAGNSSSRVGAEMLKELAGIDLLHVPYKSLNGVLTDAMSGEIDIVVGDTMAIMPLVKSGRLRALGVTTPNRMAAYENVPTVAEQGVPGYEFTGWIAAFALKGTPPDIADKLNAMIVQVMKSPDAAKFFGESAWTPIPSSREEFARFQRAEVVRWARVVKSAGIEPE